MNFEVAIPRIHVMVLSKLLNTLDATVVIRRIDRFIIEPFAAALRRRRLKRTLAEMAGSLADVDIPGWESPESAAAWVRNLRGGALGTPSQGTGPGPGTALKPAVADDVSAFIAELSEIASQLSQMQRSALIETARDELAHRTRAGSSPTFR